LENDVLALGISRYADMKGLPRSEGFHVEGALVSWMKWIPDGFGLFSNAANTARSYWSLSYAGDKSIQYIKIGDTLMTILQVEELCHSLECHVGVDLPTNNRYSKVHLCNSFHEQENKIIDLMIKSNAYYKILNLTSMLE
jgi:hypothetical protein